MENWYNPIESLAVPHRHVPTIDIDASAGSARFAVPYLPAGTIGYFETLAETPISVHWGTYGNQLENLQRACSALTEWKVALDSLLPYAYVQIAPTQCVLSFEELLTVFDAPQDTTIVTEFKGILNWIRASLHADDLLLKFWKRLKRIKTVLHAECTRFCGLSWSRRLWFLLHGSHPPKLDSRISFQEFECACV
jgi:hypothetical protein